MQGRLHWHQHCQTAVSAPTTSSIVCPLTVRFLHGHGLCFLEPLFTRSSCWPDLCQPRLFHSDRIMTPAASVEPLSHGISNLELLAGLAIVIAMFDSGERRHPCSSGALSDPPGVLSRVLEALGEDLNASRLGHRTDSSSQDRGRGGAAGEARGGRCGEGCGRGHRDRGQGRRWRDGWQYNCPCRCGGEVKSESPIEALMP